MVNEVEGAQSEVAEKDLEEASQKAWEEAQEDLVFRLLVPYHLAGVVCCQEVGTVNEEALVKDFLDLMTVLDQEEAEEVVACLAAQVA